MPVQWSGVPHAVGFHFFNFMEWLNLHTSVLDSAEFVGEEPVNQATWLKLQRYCIGQENGGVITDCQGWKDRKWQQLVRVTQDEVQSESELWTWDEGNLYVRFYPNDKEAMVKAKRETAKTNGSKGGRPKSNPGVTNQKPTLVISEKAEGNGREEKGMEKRERDGADAPRSLATCPSDYFQEIAQRVNSCSLAWQAAPILNPREKASIKANLEALNAIQPESWDAIKTYLTAKISEGMPKYQPKSRIKLIENASDVLNYALQWQRNNRPAMPKPKPQPENSDEPELTLEQTLSILKGLS